MTPTGPKITMLLGAFALAATSVPAAAQFDSLLNSSKRGADKADYCGKGSDGTVRDWIDLTVRKP